MVTEGIQDAGRTLTNRWDVLLLKNDGGLKVFTKSKHTSTLHTYSSVIVV